MRRREHQSGFGAIGVILVVLAVAILASTGLVVYQHHKSGSTKNSAGTSPTLTTAQPQSAATTQPAQAATRYLTITEWGVRLALDSKTETLYYHIKPQLPDVAYLSLKTFSNIAPNCAPDKTALAAISRQTPAERQDALNKGFQAGTLQVGNYYYGYTKANAGCTDGTAAMRDTINKAQPYVNLEDTFKTLQVAPYTN